MSINKRDLTQPVIADLTFNDVDELTLRLDGWDTDWRQLAAGRPQNQIEVIAGQQTVLQKFRLSHSIHQQGRPPSQWLTFGFLDSQNHLNWGGRNITGPAMLDFNGASGYESVSGSDFSGVTVSVSKQKFSRIAERLGLQAIQLDDTNMPRLFSDKNDALGELRRYLHDLCARVPKARSSKDQHFAMAELDEELPVHLLTTLAESRLEWDDQPLMARQKGLRLAIDYIEANCQYNPSVLDICAATGLSWRSLDRAFKECLGIGPKRYLLNLRLTHARRQLKSAPPRTKVINVANDLGFWHMGDFARQYRKMFCELPVETLKR